MYFVPVPFLGHCFPCSLMPLVGPCFLPSTLVLPTLRSLLRHGPGVVPTLVMRLLFTHSFSCSQLLDNNCTTCQKCVFDSLFHFITTFSCLTHSTTFSETVYTLPCFNPAHLNVRYLFCASFWRPSISAFTTIVVLNLGTSCTTETN